MKNLNIAFESENIYFVYLSKTLINEYLKMYNNQAIQKKLFKKNFTKEQILKWIEKLFDEKNEIFTMISKKQKKFIGNIEIIKTKEKTGEIIISITPLMQNKHYGSEAIKRIIQYGFEKLKLENFEINVYKNNQPAINCYKKVGFKINSENDNTYYMTYK